MDAIQCLKSRRSVRSFTDELIPRPVIEELIDCGRLAASANNLQPWAFVVVEEAGARKRLAEMTDYGKFIAQSPVCVAVFCQNVKYYLEDGSAATQNILNAAAAHGLGSCWVAGDKKLYAPQIAELLGLPPDYRLVSLIAIGHPASSRSSPPKKALAEVLHWDRYGAGKR